MRKLSVVCFSLTWRKGISFAGIYFSRRSFLIVLFRVIMCNSFENANQKQCFNSGQSSMETEHASENKNTKTYMVQAIGSFLSANVGEIETLA